MWRCYTNAVDLHVPCVSFLQNVFVAYKWLTPHALHPKLPFGLAQEGRVYRNEISGARSGFLLRLREFRQFEVE